jgi:hypothetical protein
VRWYKLSSISLSNTLIYLEPSFLYLSSLNLPYSLFIRYLIWFDKGNLFMDVSIFLDVFLVPLSFFSRKGELSNRSDSSRKTACLWSELDSTASWKIMNWSILVLQGLVEQGLIYLYHLSKIDRLLLKTLFSWNFLHFRAFNDNNSIRFTYEWLQCFFSF